MAVNEGRSRRARLYVDIGGGALPCAVTGGCTGGSWSRNSAGRRLGELQRRRWRRRRRQQERALGLSFTMPTVEELYRNYGILADATEQVGQVSSLAACGARRSAAFRKRSPGRRGLLLRPPAGSQPPRLFRQGGPLAGSADSGFTRESAVPGFQAPLPPLISLFSPWRVLTASSAPPASPPRSVSFRALSSKFH